MLEPAPDVEGALRILETGGQLPPQPVRNMLSCNLRSLTIERVSS